MAPGSLKGTSIPRPSARSSAACQYGVDTTAFLLLFEIRGNINISRADELGEFLQLDELVKEDDVALDSVFAGKPLETQTICFAMIANEIGMRGVYSMSSASSAV